MNKNDAKRTLRKIEAYKYIKTQISKAESVDINKEEKEINFQLANNNRHQLILPVNFPKIDEADGINEILEKLKEKQSYLIILMRAGDAAIGYISEGKIAYHKTISKYMVRKKQGKAQITYLKKKGKSRLGSRIRLAQTKEYFEEIIDLLNNLATKSKINRIYYSISVNLWGMLFKQKEKIFFSKDDERLIKVPFSVKKPNFKELKRINYLLNASFLSQNTAT